jgi:hypothetical protein
LTGAKNTNDMYDPTRRSDTYLCRKEDVGHVRRCALLLLVLFDTWCDFNDMVNGGNGVEECWWVGVGVDMDVGVRWRVVS